MSRYRALENLLTGVSSIRAGSEFDAAEAGIDWAGVRRLLDRGAIKPAQAAEETTPREADDPPYTSDGGEAPVTLAAAIAAIDPDDSAAWLKGGAPQISALRKAAGRDDITAAERDTAWADYQAALWDLPDEAQS